VNHRERVLAAFAHKEADRVPIDLGGTDDSGIAAVTYRDLRIRLGLPQRITHVADTFSQLAVVEDDVREALGIDTTSLFLQPREWHTGQLVDGTPALVPALWKPQLQPDGSQLILDSSGRALMKMPRDGYYFDLIHAPLADASRPSDLDEYMNWIQNNDLAFYLDKSYEEMAEDLRVLREKTDYAVGTFFGGHFLWAGMDLRGAENFLLDLTRNQEFAEALMDRLLDVYLERFERFARTLGRYSDFIEFDEDLGTQDAPFLSPEMYRKLIKPRQKKLFSFVKSRCDARIFFHSDGAIRPVIPDLIDAGIDILNPLQVSARGMDPKELKKEFGKDLVLWGGGCDTQAVLPFGTPEQVRDEVRRRIDDLAPGGGYVFATVHNVQARVPVDNAIAAFQAAREYGEY
jgi:uroporphyrinogen decarboxylase